jgi:hypothetical protein
MVARHDDLVSSASKQDNRIGLGVDQHVVARAGDQPCATPAVDECVALPVVNCRVVADRTELIAGVAPDDRLL